MSTLKVDGIRSNSASSDAITLASDGTCTANITNKPNRNLIINGAMNVAQRGTSSTSSGYHTVDRFQGAHTGTDEAPTQAQVDVASGTTPYTLGFRKALKITNGNQTSGAGSGDTIQIVYKVEAQDLTSSGWNYKSASSYITLSFWVKSSVAQEFHGFLLSSDSTRQLYSFSTGSLSADTWTKVTKTIPGNSNINMTHGNGEGLMLRITQFAGTDKTGTITQNQWADFSSSVRYPNNTSTWYTTNDATFELTGVQLEVGDHETDFEHRSYGQELALCQRYYYRTGDDGTTTNILSCAVESSSLAAGGQPFPTTMRALPTITIGSAVRFYSPATGTITFTVNANRCSTTHMALYLNISSGTEGQAASIYKADTSNGYVEASAEL